MIGVRLDSGDLASLRTEARRILDEGGFPQAAIVASNDLDERIVETLKQQQAPRSAFGASAPGLQPAATIQPWAASTSFRPSAALANRGGTKSSSPNKRPRSRRPVYCRYAAGMPIPTSSRDAVHLPTPFTTKARRATNADDHRRSAGHDAAADDAECAEAHEDLLVPVFRSGRRVYESPDLPAIRHRAAEQLAGFPDGVKRFVIPPKYFVGLERGLHEPQDAAHFARAGVVAVARGTWDVACQLLRPLE